MMELQKLLRNFLYMPIMESKTLFVDPRLFYWLNKEPICWAAFFLPNDSDAKHSLTVLAHKDLTLSLEIDHSVDVHSAERSGSVLLIEANMMTAMLASDIQNPRIAAASLLVPVIFNFVHIHILSA